MNANPHCKGTDPAGANYRGIHSPLDQFSIRKFIQFTFNIVNNTKFTITNIGVYIVISAYVSSAWNIISNNLKKTVSNLWSSSQESIYATIHGIVLNQINAVKGQMFFPFIYVIFIFILVSNLIGMIPYNFSSTSHFILTFLISFTVVVGSTLLGLLTYRLIFFSVFVPSGCPVGLLPLLVLIELISYLARNISLGLRLAANVLSGHMLLNILSDFAYKIIGSGFKNAFVGSVPVSFIIAFSALEMAICFIQAQVFSVLSSSYIKDGIVSH
uniref:ATP synthase subunit a n=1 Tax=Bacidia sp. TaxID=2040699 RepID=A0A482JZ87_9LECA|nr:ATP synthase F0 subunit 6 [Bacidia sp.]